MGNPSGELTLRPVRPLYFFKRKNRVFVPIAV
jgi:hypothetical protein